MKDFAEAVIHSGGDLAEPQGDLEGGRRLFAEDRQDVGHAESLPVAQPEELGALAHAQRAVSGSGHAVHGGFLLGREVELAEKAVAFAHEEVARVERDRDAEPFVERLGAVALAIVVLDVVVDQRCLVKALHRHEQLVRPRGESAPPVFLQSLVNARREKGPPALSRLGQPVAADLLGVAPNRSERRVEVRLSEEIPNLLAERLDVDARGVTVGSEVDGVPHPVEVGVGARASVVKQRDGHARDRARFHVGKDLLEDREAAHTDDRLDLARLDEGHDQRRPLGHENDVTETLRLGLEVVDRAVAAQGAEQAELVDLALALGLVPHALGQEQKAPVHGDLCERRAPEFIVHQNGEVVLVLAVDARGARRFPRDAPQFVLGNGGDEVPGAHRVGNHVTHPVPFGAGLADRLLHARARGGVSLRCFCLLVRSFVHVQVLVLGMVLLPAASCKSAARRAALVRSGRTSAATS